MEVTIYFSTKRGLSQAKMSLVHFFGDISEVCRYAEIFSSGMEERQSRISLEPDL